MFLLSLTPRPAQGFECLLARCKCCLWLKRSGFRRWDNAGMGDPPAGTLVSMPRSGRCRFLDLCAAVGEYLRAFINRKDGLLFQTRNGTPYLHNSLEQTWLKPRLS